MTNKLLNVRHLHFPVTVERYLKLSADMKAKRKRPGNTPDYWPMVPDYLIARCPLCATEYREPLDTNALRWWYPPSTGKEVFLSRDRARHCEHKFLVHRFINLNGIRLSLSDPETGGYHLDFITEVPHVIPMILSKDSQCQAVMHSLPICGIENEQFVPRYMVYILTYFAPVQEHDFLLKRIEAFIADMEDFRSYLAQPFGSKLSEREAEQWWDLSYWAQRDKLLWLEPDTDDLPLRTRQEAVFPYGGISGRKVPYTFSEPPWETGQARSG